MPSPQAALTSSARDLAARLPRLHPVLVSLLWLGGLVVALAGPALFGPIAYVAAFALFTTYFGWWLLWALEIDRRARGAMSEPERPYMRKLALWVFATGVVSGVLVGALEVMGLGGDDQPWFIKAPMDLLALATIAPLLVMLWTAASAHARSFGPVPGGQRTLFTFLGLYLAPVGVWVIKPR